MAKYSKGAQKGVESAMKRMEKGKLRSGRSGRKVTNPKQAIAIGLSEAKKKGAKVPVKKKAAPKKVVSKKKTAAAKKPVPKKSTVKKTAVKKATPRKVIAKKKVVTKKTAPAKVVAIKPIAKKVVAKPVAKKKVATVKVPEPMTMPVPASLETVPLIPEGLVEKTANTNGNGTQQMMVTGDGLDELVNTEDPVRAFDKHASEIAASKGDPHSNMKVSSVSRAGIKPSGKKPLWKR